MLCNLGNEFPEKKIPWRLEIMLTLIECNGAANLSDVLDREDGWDWYEAAWVASHALNSANAFKQSEVEARLKQQNRK